MRAGAGDRVIAGWDAEFCEQAAAVDAGRRLALDVAVSAMQEVGEELLGHTVGFEYRPGWSEERPLAETLQASLERDRQQGSTQAGPHRGDLRLRYDERQARKLVLIK